MTTANRYGDLPGWTFESESHGRFGLIVRAIPDNEDEHCTVYVYERDREIRLAKWDKEDTPIGVVLRALKLAVPDALKRECGCRKRTLTMSSARTVYPTKKET